MISNASFDGDPLPGTAKKVYAAALQLSERFLVTTTADADTRIQAMQDQISALNTTLDGITSGDLIPKTDLLDANPNLIGSDGKVDLTNLAAAMPNSGSELLKGADDATATEVAVKIGDNEVAISKDELGELLATKKDTYKEALTAGFTTAEEGTAAQIKTIAAAKEFGVNLSADATDTDAKATAEAFDKVAQEFLKAGVTVADVLESGDTELIEQTKKLVSDPEAAAAAAAAREKLDNYVSPFGGVATVTALDIIKLATKAGRALDGGTTITDVDVLGTDDLSDTNAAFIGALTEKSREKTASPSAPIARRWSLSSSSMAQPVPARPSATWLATRRSTKKMPTATLCWMPMATSSSPPPPKVRMPAMKERNTTSTSSTCRTTTWSNTARLPPMKKMTTAM